MVKANRFRGNAADSPEFVIEYIPYPRDAEEDKKRREEIREILAQMFIRARKRGRPKKDEEELKDAA